MAPTRLIDTETLKLVTEFPSDSAYAILSHRWVDEPTLQEWGSWSQTADFRDHGFYEALPLSKKSGAKKIANFSQKARGEGYRYAWVDTVCIDKTNSAELSEAINSMFAWYRGAGLCIVYLNDVDPPFPDTFREPAPDFYGSWNRSEWFCRGWTLQELLAPATMEFYAKDWEYLGTKGSLVDLLQETTKIPRDYLLHSQEIFYSSVAERMSWAAIRQTKRPEDLAYCLMGLFGVNMPPLYGEGLRNAYRRLQEEIVKTSTDQSIFSWEWPQDWTGGDQDWISVFAPEPRAFNNNIQRVLPSLDQTFSPEEHEYSITNVGLKIRLIMIPSAQVSGNTNGTYVEQPLVYGALGCFEEKDRKISNSPKLLALPLWRIGEAYFRLPFPSAPVEITVPGGIWAPHLSSVVYLLRNRWLVRQYTHRGISFYSRIGDDAKTNIYIPIRFSSPVDRKIAAYNPLSKSLRVQNVCLSHGLESKSQWSGPLFTIHMTDTHPVGYVVELTIKKQPDPQSIALLLCVGVLTYYPPSEKEKRLVCVCKLIAATVNNDISSVLARWMKDLAEPIPDVERLLNHDFEGIGMRPSTVSVGNGLISATPGTHPSYGTFLRVPRRDHYRDVVIPINVESSGPAHESQEQSAISWSRPVPLDSGDLCIQGCRE